MKRLLIILVGAVLLATDPALAQTEEEQLEMQEKMWDNSDPDAKLTTAPAKWKGESAVILYKQIEYSLSKELPENHLHQRSNLRTRIKLQDRAAVQQYSELSFDGSESYSFGGNMGGLVFVGIKVVKPDGRETKVEVDNTALMEIQQGYAEKNYKKIAVPNLEPGDIIDYYHCVHKSGMAAATFLSFDQILYALPEEYPVVKQKIHIFAQPKFYLNVRSVNGAPEFKPVTSSKPGQLQYTLIDSAREKTEEQRWEYPYRTQPSIKIQAYYGASQAIVRKNSLHHFMGTGGQIKNNISDKELLAFVNENLTAWPSTGNKIVRWFFKGLLLNFRPIDTSWSRDILAYLNRKHATETDPETIAREAYYYFRQMSYVKDYEGQVLYDMGGSDGVSDYQFVRNMSRVLEKKKIDHDVILTSYRNTSVIDDAVIPSELTIIIRVNGKKPFFITNFSRYSNFNDLDTNYQGNKGLAVNISPVSKTRTIAPVSIPVMAADINTEVVTLEARLDSAESGLLHVTRKSTFEGANRFGEQDWWLTPYEYLEACRNDKYDINSLAESNQSASQKTEITSRMEIKQQEDLKNRNQSLKARLEEDYAFNVVKVDDVKILQTGIWHDAPALTCTDRFQTEDLVSKVGDNYLVEAGRLIGGQMELQKKELERNTPVFMPYARSFTNTISIAIPAGYEARGLEKLNFNVANQTGGFISNAKIEGNKVVITTKKFYNNNSEPASEWPKMVSFMEAAYEFTQQKILFRKM